MRSDTAVNFRAKMKVTITKGVLLLGSLLLFGGHVSNPSRAQSGGGSASKTSRAQAVFEDRCARCHGRDGRGQTKLGEMLGPPDFTDAAWQKAATDARMKSSIVNGVGGMPAFKRTLSARDLNALVAHVRGFARRAR